MHEFEKRQWLFWKRTGVPVISVPDSWNRMKDRYSLGKKRVLTDYAGAIDEKVRRELVRVGFRKKDTFIVGQPYLEGLLSLGKKHTKASRANARKEFGIRPSEYAILFPSERFGKLYKYGYTEKDALREVVGACKALAKEGLAVHLLIKLHPEEREGKYAGTKFPASFRTTVFGQGANQRKLIEASDMVCGCTSIMLFESAARGRDTISVQPNLSGEDNCQASRAGIIPLVKKNGELSALLKKAIVGKRLGPSMGKGRLSKFSGSTEKLIRTIRKIAS